MEIVIEEKRYYLYDLKRGRNALNIPSNWLNGVDIDLCYVSYYDGTTKVSCFALSKNNFFNEGVLAIPNDAKRPFLFHLKKATPCIEDENRVNYILLVSDRMKDRMQVEELILKKLIKNTGG